MRSYASKYITAAQAVQCVKSGDWVDYNFCLGHPRVLDQALAARKEELHDINIRGGIVLEPLAVMEEDPELKHFAFHSWHMGGYERRMNDKGRCCYIPLIYSLMPHWYRKHLPVDVAFISVSPMDAHGYFSVSFTNSATRAIVDKSRIVVLEVNTQLPFIAGADATIHISEVDYVVEGENTPIPTLASAAPSDLDHAIATRIINELRDGDVIQLGIGALPNAVGQHIAQSDLKNLGAHTELFVDAYMHMINAGRITNQLKNINRGKSMFTFAAGSTELYEWMRHNNGLYSAPVDYVNAPATMAAFDAMVSINTCIEVDLTGQVNAEASGRRHISGSGGQIDFAAGTALSPNGRGYICCQSTYTDKTGQRHSRIVPALALGTAVSNQRGYVSTIVTEWGMAHLSGVSLWERAERLIAIAHPDFHDELINGAEKANIWRRSNKSTKGA